MRKINLFAILTMASAMSVCFVSCEDEDGDKESSVTIGNKPIKKITHNDGKYESETTFIYSGNKVTQFQFKNEDGTQTVDIEKIVGKSKESTIDMMWGEVTFKTNEDGFLSTVESLDGEYLRKTSFEYNSDDYLAKIVHVDNDENKDVNYSSLTLIYSEGNLVSAKMSSRENETSKISDYATASFKTSEYENKNGIFCPWLEADDDLGSLTAAFYYAGLLGKSTKYLVEEVTESWVVYDSVETIQYKYQFDSSDEDVISCNWENWSTYKITYQY